MSLKRELESFKESPKSTYDKTRHFESTIDHVDEVKIETDLVVEVFSDIFGGVQ